MMQGKWLWALGLLCFVLLIGLQAHEFRPGHLKLMSQQEGGVEIMLKQPVLNDGRGPTRGMNLSVILPDHCQIQARRLIKTEGFWLEQFKTPCELMGDQDVIKLKNLERFATDVFVEVFDDDQLRFHTLLYANKTLFSLTKAEFSFFYYLKLGLKHLLLGIDHVLFLLGILLVLVTGYGAYLEKKAGAMTLLLKHSLVLISLFTLAHGLSLLLSVYGVLQLPRLSIEAIIALSLVFLASQQLADNTYCLKGLSVSVFIFGLIHGFGFSGVLVDIGFSASSQFLTILLFNLGIEIGQLVLGVPLLLSFVLLFGFHKHLFFDVRNMAFYMIGSVGMFFFLKRFLVIIIA